MTGLSLTLAPYATNPQHSAAMNFKGSTSTSTTTARRDRSKTFIIRSVRPSLPKTLDHPIDVVERPIENPPEERPLSFFRRRLYPRYSYHEIVALHVWEDMS